MSGEGHGWFLGQVRGSVRQSMVNLRCNIFLCVQTFHNFSLSQSHTSTLPQILQMTSYLHCDIMRKLQLEQPVNIVPKFLIHRNS
jgi:hypothetical protein